MPSLSSSKIILVFLVVSVIVISNAATNVPKAHKLVHNVCRKLRDEQFCLAVLKSDARSKFAKDITTLTTIAINVATKNSTATRDYFIRLKTGPLAVLKSLNDCINSYNNVITSFKFCLNECECSLIGYDIYVGGDAVRRCQAIADFNGAHNSFITTSNNVTLKFCGLGESLANLMCNEREA